MKSIYSKSNKVISYKDEILPSLIELQSIARSQLYHRFSDPTPLMKRKLLKSNQSLEEMQLLKTLHQTFQGSF